VSIYGRLGVFRGVAKGGGVQAHTSETNYGPTYGVGLQSDVMTNLGVRAEWQAYPAVAGSRITRSDVNVISLSAFWRFR
jgi:opacity protein-like surface antigen